MGDSPVVLITGASSGTGFYAAHTLAQRGAKVFGTTRDVRRADAVLAACRDAGVSIEVLELDVRSEASVHGAVDAVIDDAGRLDVLVNNAAVATFAPLEFTTNDQIADIVDTNLLGPIRMIQAVLPHMRRQGAGRIVNVGSVSAEPKFGVPLLAAYAATKGGLRALSLDLNKELAPLGIDVVLCEGGIGGRSGMFEMLHTGVDALGWADGAYHAVEGWSRRFAAVLDNAAPDSSASGAIVADACLAERPDLRHPAARQQTLDVAHRISDADYLDMCRGSRIIELSEQLGATAFTWRTRLDA